MNMYILFKMFVLCYFCNIDMYIFDKINVLYLLTLLYSGQSLKACQLPIHIARSTTTCNNI